MVERPANRRSAQARYCGQGIDTCRSHARGTAIAHIPYKTATCEAQGGARHPPLDRYRWTLCDDGVQDRRNRERCN